MLFDIFAFNKCFYFSIIMIIMVFGCTCFPDCTLERGGPKFNLCNEEGSINLLRKRVIFDINYKKNILEICISNVLLSSLLRTYLIYVLKLSSNFFHF